MMGNCHVRFKGEGREVILIHVGDRLNLTRQHDNRKQLNLLFKVAQNDSLPGSSFHKLVVPMTSESLAGYVAMTGKSLNLPDAYNLSTDIPYKFDKSFDQTTGYRTCSVLILPIQNRHQEIIGVLQLINRKVKPGVVLTKENAQELTQPYSEKEERILYSLASQAASHIYRKKSSTREYRKLI